MDFELKDFETKINDITEQFMSLLDSNKAIEEKVTNKFENAAINFERKIDTPQVGGEYGVNSAYSNSSFSFDANGFQNSKVGGIAFENTNATPAHAIRFDDISNDDLNKRLEELFEEKRADTAPSEPASIAFSDSNLVAVNSYSYNNNYTNEKTNSENEKEGYNMANYGFTEGDDNSIFSFATVPQERALEPKRSFSDVLFMDIPWDTKIDIWGGIKSLFTTEVRFTF